MPHTNPAAPNKQLAPHILPTACTMIGVCTTLIGLVKVAEGHIGPSQVDEYTSLDMLLFLASALLSYCSIRRADTSRLGARLEHWADRCFIAGLVGLSLIALFFAYELI